MLKYLIVFVVSMVPIVELRGAIPIGIGMGLDLIPTYIVAVVGNMVPVPFIYLLASKVLPGARISPSLAGPAGSF